MLLFWVALYIAYELYTQHKMHQNVTQKERTHYSTENTLQAIANNTTTIFLLPCKRKIKFINAIFLSKYTFVHLHECI